MSNSALFTLTSWIATISIFFGVVIGLIRFQKLGYAQRCLVFLMAGALLIEVAAKSLMFYKKPTYPVFHIYAVIEYLLLALVFIKAFKLKVVNQFGRASILLFIVFAVLNAVYVQPITTPNTNVVTVSGSIFIAASIVFLYRTLNHMTYTHIEQSALFWIITGVLIYFSSTVIMFVFLAKLTPVSMELMGTVLVLNASFNIIHYLCFNIALWMDPE